MPARPRRSRPAAVAKGAARTLAAVAATLFGLLLVTFLIGRAAPIDPALAAVGDRAGPEAYEAARRALGLDRPLPEQFAAYAANALRGDLGVSTVTSRPVAEDIARFFPATVELATAAMAIGLAFGVPAGVVAAARRGRWPDFVLRVVTLFGYSAPTFWLGMIALLVFYATLGWAAGPGRLDVIYEDLVPATTGLLVLDSMLAGEWRIARDALAHMALPASILGYFSMAYIARMTRSFMIEQLATDYVLAARARGLSEARVVWRHALGNTAVPLVTVVALSWGALLEGSVLTETVFAWPGLGGYLTAALLNADMNAVLGATLVIGVVFVGLNLAADLLYRRLDPRIGRAGA